MRVDSWGIGRALSRLGARPLATLVLAGVVLSGGTFLFASTTVDRTMRADATATAASWASYLAENINDLDAIAAGAAPSPETVAFVEQVIGAGDVFRFKIFDNQGHLRLVSDELEFVGQLDTDREDVHVERALQVLRHGESTTQLAEGTLPERPLYYAETYSPVFVDGEVTIVVEVYVDLTVKRELFYDNFKTATAVLALLTAISFGIPATGLHLRSRQKKKMEASLRFMAHHDAMTGLLNRSSFTRALDVQLAESAVAGDITAVLYVDVDRFKEVNDTRGHDAGDELIQLVSDRLRRSVAPGDIVARCGGDEFVIAVCGTTEQSELADRAAALCQDLGQPYWVGGYKIVTTASVGIAIAPADGNNSTALVKAADLAMYYAKANNRAGYCFFEPAMDERAKERRRLERAVRDAAAFGRFRLYFQPIFSASDGNELIGFEALLRLPSGIYQGISPAKFVPWAEELGLIIEVGSWVLREACHVAASLPEKLTMSVNLSPKQFKEASITRIVGDALAESGLAPHRLELEITEGLLLTDMEEVLEELATLKALGVSIAMDDFGTGYSGFSYLWRFPFDKIKIDQSFMTAFEGNKHDIEEIIGTIVALGRSLGMKVTAEGIETTAQAKLASRVACDQVQGFYYGRPTPETELGALVLGSFKQSTRTVTRTSPPLATKRAPAASK